MRELTYFTYIVMMVSGLILSWATYSVGGYFYEQLVSTTSRPSSLFFAGMCILFLLEVDVIFVVLFKNFREMAKEEE